MKNFLKFAIVSLFLMSGFIRPAHADVTAGLVGWWKFDGNANDSAGINNGTLIGGPSFVAGKIGSNALSFDGVDDGVDVAGTTAYANTGSPFTMSAWYYLDSSALGNYPDLILLRTNTNSGLHFLFSADSSYLGFSMGSASDWTTIKTDDER